MAAIAFAAAALAVGGGLMSSKKRGKALKAQEEAARRQAFFQRLQADEILRRAEINANILERQGEQFKGSQIAAFGASGVEVGTGSPLEVLKESQLQIDEQISNLRDEADFRARMVRAGAQESDIMASGLSKAASAEKVAGFFRAVSGGVSAFAGGGGVG